MAYSPFTWKDGNAGGTPLTADRLNALELGVKGAHDTADANATALAGKAPLARGVPAGGTAGQLLVKNSSADYAAGWQTPSTTVPAHTHPESGVDGLVADLQAIRTAAFGGPSRTQAPAAYFYLNADTAYQATRNYVWTGTMTKVADPDGMVNLTAAPGCTITVPVAGLYLIEYHAASTATSDALYTRVLLNAPDYADASITTYALLSNTGFGGSEGTHSHIAATRALAAGDKLTFAFYGRTAGTFKPTWFGGTRQTFMGIRYVGPSQT
jgi:hypothetical protein